MNAGSMDGETARSSLPFPITDSLGFDFICVYLRSSAVAFCF
jgi:hypothetical protein